MKRAALLFCADVDPARFKLLKQRDQLPFHVPDHEHDAKWADYSLEQAYRLRIMLDLIDDASEATYPAGLGPQFAQSVAGNVGVSSKEAWGCRPALWVGVVGFEGINRHDEKERWPLRFNGPLSALEGKIAKEKEDNSAAYREILDLQMFLANATRAAEFVMLRAAELGISEGNALRTSR